MNGTLFSRNAMLVVLLTCPLAKADYDLNNVLTELKHVILAGAVGYGAKKVDKQTQLLSKISGGRITSENVGNVITNTTYSVSRDNEFKDGANWAAHGVAAVATEAALTTRVGTEIILNTPILGSLYKTHQGIASFLVYLGLDHVLSPSIKDLLKLLKNTPFHAQKA